MENEISYKGENIEILLNKVASDKKSAILYMVTHKDKDIICAFLLCSGQNLTFIENYFVALVQ